MTDAQQQMALITLICGAAGGILKWIVGQWREERKCDRDAREKEMAERKLDRDAQISATVEMAKHFAVFTTKLDAFEKKLDRVDAAVEEVADEVSGVHRAANTRKPSQRADTAPLGGFHGPRRPRQDTP